MSGNGLITTTDITCPACEYERSDAGKPVSDNGQMRCMACGNTWKEFGNSVQSIAEPAIPNAETLFKQEFAAREVAPIRQGKSGLAGVALLSFLFVIGIGATVLFLRGGFPVFEKQGLYVEGLQFEELVRSGRGKVVKVQGVIANSSEDIETLPRLAIVLRKSNGDELTRWYYRSPLFKLKPGSRARFVSSIPYDTPVIASVEALFE